MDKGLFLDRDGTLIEHVEYLADPAKVVLCPGIRAALVQALELGFLLFIHTNQSGVGRGFFGIETVHAINQRMLDLLDLPQGAIQEICIAPEHPDEAPNYRKPSPKFINEMVTKYGLDRKQCYMVGDSSRDVEAAHNAQIHAIFIQNSRLPKHETLQAKHGKIPTYPSLLDWVVTLH